jgi:hypothetical protein
MKDKEIELYTIQKHLKAIRDYVKHIPRLRKKKMDEIEILCCDVLTAIKERQRKLDF